MNAYLIIRDRYENFSKAYKKISDYILSNPQYVIKSTALDITKKCENVTRLEIIKKKRRHLSYKKRHNRPIILY